MKAWKKVPSSQLEPKAVPLPLPLAIKPLLDFDWRSVKPQKFRPFKPVYHITMGEFYFIINLAVKMRG